jgi:hypothetical protein
MQAWNSEQFSEENEMSMERPDNPQESFDLDRLAAEVEQTPEAQQKKPRRTALIIAGIVGVIMLLGAAAFVAFRLLRPETAAIDGGPGGAGLYVSGGQNGGSRSFKIDVTPAPELPTTPADVLGTYSRMDGNSLFIFQHVKGAMGPVNQNTGPEIEIVITTDTQLYKDATTPPNPDKVDESQAIQQKVEPIEKLENIGEKTMFTVWGEHRGDRVIATVIVYSEPIIRMIPGSGK